MAVGSSSGNDVGLSIVVNCIVYSVTHIPYLLTLGLLQKVPADRRIRAIVLGAAILFRIIAFQSPPLLSDDLNRYRWEAKVMDQGRNPYRVSPRELPLGEANVPVPEASAVYGPILEGVQWLAWKTTGNLKVSGALAEVLLLALSFWWIERQRWPFWRWVMLAWSPLLIYEFWGQGHNDSWLLLLLFASVALAQIQQRVWSWALLGGAILTKWWPLLLAPLWLARSASWPGGLLAAAMGVACLFLLPPAELWLKLRFTSGFLGGWQNNAFLYRFLTDKTQAIALLCVGSLALPFLHLGWMELMLCAVSGLLLVSANIHPWYLSWFLPFLAASRWNPLPWLLWAALMPLCYDPMIAWRANGIWREDPWIRDAIPLLVLGFSVFCMLWRRKG